MTNDKTLKLTLEQVWRPALFFLVLGLFLKALSMAIAPVHWDTNYYLNIGSNFIERGELTPYMWRLGADTNIIAGSGTGYGILLLDYWFKFFGLSLLSGYIFMYIIGLASLVVIYFVARDWWCDPIAGIGAVVFVVLSQSFIESFYIRMDAPALLAYSLILWLHLSAVHSNRNVLHAAVGVALILAAEIHILALLYVVALSFYYAVEHLQTMRQQRRLWIITPSLYYFSGLLMAGIAYFLVHVAPDPEAYFIIVRKCPFCEPAGPIKELQRYIIIMKERGIEALIFVIALAAAFLRRSKADSHYITLVFGFFIALAVVSPPAQIQYMSHMLPLIGVGIGGLFAKAYTPDGTLNFQRLRIGVVIASYLFLNQYSTLLLISANKPATPPGIEYVREYIPTDTVVMGLPSLFHNLLEYGRFLSYQSGERYGIALRHEDYLTFWARERPVVFVGEPAEDDGEWWFYMKTHDFQQVREDVWVAGDLLEKLVAQHPAPEITYSAVQTTVNFGECTRLEWSTANVDEVKLNDETVDQVGSREVCPYTTTTYDLTAYWAGDMEKKSVTITVK
jgi:hypothetical protein